MKVFASLAALQLVLQGTAACIGGIMPDFHLLNISNSPHVPQEVRERANFTYFQTQKLRAQRESLSGPAQGGEGITPNLDDSEFDQEQSAGDAAQIARERAALLNSQQHQPADPGYVEDNEAPAPTNYIDRRSIIKGRVSGASLESRQANNAPFIGIWSDNMDCNLTPPDVLVRDNLGGAQKAVDSDAEDAFTNLVDVYRFYNTIFGRDSINGTGGSIWGTIHYCTSYSNAIWDGIQIYLGDGDGYAYTARGYVRSLSVIGHEFTHGVIQYENPLFYSGMSGALNEHLADVFGALTIQYYNKQDANSATWLIAQGLVVNGRALRDMQFPGTAYNNPTIGNDPQPNNMAGYYNGADDNYGVHINSGIPNRAFVLFAKAIGGNAYARPGRIWYNVLTRLQGRFDYTGETFRTFAQKTINEADVLYGRNIATSLENAWQTVGVL